MVHECRLDPMQVLADIKKHARKYYNRHIQLWNLDMEELVMACYLGLLEERWKNINTALSCQVRYEIKLRAHEVSVEDLKRYEKELAVIEMEIEEEDDYSEG